MSTIKLTLSSSDIQHAIDEVKKRQKWLQERSQELLRELAGQGAAISSVKFSSAQYDGTNDVSVTTEERGDKIMAVVAVGNATLFIEFGTGVNYPNSHPEAGKYGFTHGSYGYHLGSLPGGWHYKGDPGTNGEVISSGKHKGEVHTYGNPANMCMYSTIRELEENFEEIARRVFSD